MFAIKGQIHLVNISVQHPFHPTTFHSISFLLDTLALINTGADLVDQRYKDNKAVNWRDHGDLGDIKVNEIAEMRQNCLDYGVTSAQINPNTHQQGVDPPKINGSTLINFNEK